MIPEIWMATFVWYIGLLYVSWKFWAPNRYFVAFEDTILLPIYSTFTLLWIWQNSPFQGLVWGYWTPLFFIGWCSLLYKAKSSKGIFIFKEGRRVARCYPMLRYKIKEVFLAYQKSPADVVMPSYGLLIIKRYLLAHLPVLEKELKEDASIFLSNRRWFLFTFCFFLLQACWLFVNAWFYAPLF